MSSKYRLIIFILGDMSSTAQLHLRHQAQPSGSPARFDFFLVMVSFAHATKAGP
jgi:hypothetical protein